jgi:serine-type D-Ala-D-Ala carboxypeptidase (penicillin-binding protein 5/6)
MRTGRFPIGTVIAVVVTVACAAFAAASAPPVARAGATTQRPVPSAARSSARSTGTGTGDVHLRKTSSAATPGTSSPAGLDTIAWPAANEAAVTVSGLLGHATPGITTQGITTHGATGPVPIASLAKIMTAYVILTDHPLTSSSQGPTITVTAADADAYAADLAAGGSVVEVRAGERLTEQQALAAMLLRSANNLATLLGSWDSGSVPRFVGRMNAAAARLGLGSTHYTEPAGWDQRTVSTAADQVRLAQAALGLPAFASIVASPSVVVPVTGVIVNYDTMLGVDGIVGVKTGYTRTAGGTMVVAARTTSHGHDVLIVGAVLGISGTETTSFGRTLDAGDQLVVGVERWLGD